jgi:hypothetical protein
MGLRSELDDGMREYNKAMIHGGPYVFAGCAVIMTGLVVLLLVMGDGGAALRIGAMFLGLAAFCALAIRLGAKNRRKLLGDEHDPYERFSRWPSRS